MYDAELATQALQEESNYRFPYFSASEACTLGLSLRKRFRASQRHAKGKGLVISIQSIAGHNLFSCTVGDLGGVSGVGDVSLDSWTVLDGMIAVVKRTGHSSYYVEKGMGAMGKSPAQMGIPEREFKIHGGAFPIWLENALCCPIAIVACYSGSSQEDHHLVVTSVKDYLKKLKRSENESIFPGSEHTGMPISEPPRIRSPMSPRAATHSEYQPSEWVTTEASHTLEIRSRQSYSDEEERGRR